MKTKKHYHSLEKRNASYGRKFILIWEIGFIIFFLIPLAQSLIFAFSDVKVGNGGFTTEFIGLKNFHYAFYEQASYTDCLLSSITDYLYRQHPSIAVWAGDNECDVATSDWTKSRINPNNNRITRIILPQVVARLDPYREYLPSSPYVSQKAFDSSEGNCLPEDHLWGPRDYFKSEFYVTSNAHFASETGYHGCPSPKSIEKFISKENLFKIDSDEWLAHATAMEIGVESPYSFRNGLMTNQVKVLFGEIPDNLDDFALASQLSQGEAMKFFIERFRTGKWRRTGIIWWNLLDGWPQFSDAIVDYYFVKKASYSIIKRSQEPVCLMMREPENGYLTLVAVNEFLTDKEITFTVKDLSNGELVCGDKGVIPSNGIIELNNILFDNKNTHFYLIEWEYDEKMYKNHYLSGKPTYSFEDYIGWLKEGELLQTEGF